MMRKQRGGFTLVELLVVIAIIGILVGLIVPAVNAALEAARRTNCMNNMKEIGKGMVSYATKKGDFPARLEALDDVKNPNQPIPVSWFARVLPELGRNDIWDAYISTSGLGVDSIYVDLAACPSEPQANKSAPWLSYACNSGTWDSNSKPVPFDDKSSGVCHNLYLAKPLRQSGQRVSPSYVSSKDGASTTLLIAENVDVEQWAAWPKPPAQVTKAILVTNPLEGQASEKGLELDLGIVWLAHDLTGNKTQNPINKGILVDTVETVASLKHCRPSSRHRGGFNAIFCDASHRFLSEEMDYRVYYHIMTPDGMHTDRAFHELGNVERPLLESQLQLWRQDPTKAKERTLSDGDLQP